MMINQSIMATTSKDVSSQNWTINCLTTSCTSSSFSESQGTEPTLELFSSLDSSVTTTTLDDDNSEEKESIKFNYNRIQQLKAKREFLEEWHLQHKQLTRQTMARPMNYSHCTTKWRSESTSKSATRTTWAMAASTPSTQTQQQKQDDSYHTLNRKERKQCRHVIERLEKARHALRVSMVQWRLRRDRHMESRRQLRAQQKGAATRLRLTQIERSLHFYRHRIAATTMVGPIPEDICNIVSFTAEWTSKRLEYELDHAVAYLSDDYPKEWLEVIRQVHECRCIERSNYRKAIMPRFRLPMAATGTVLDSSKMRGRSIIVVYLGHWSSLCMTTLRAWQRVYQQSLSNKQRRKHSHSVLAVSTETIAGTQHTLQKSGVKFPILVQGQSLLDRLGMLERRNHDHPMEILRQKISPLTNQSPSLLHPLLPKTATMVVDWTTDSDGGSILYWEVSLDPTQRTEPLPLMRQYLES